MRINWAPVALASFSAMLHVLPVAEKHTMHAPPLAAAPPLVVAEDAEEAPLEVELAFAEALDPDDAAVLLEVLELHPDNAAVHSAPSAITPTPEVKNLLREIMPAPPFC